ncbi:MAG: YbhB/YbcL family Raf kinase inhibitor-like protein [Myxococcales bacterium]|nr:YbhB/YbcL family Raf kinase inhibitor-like protein [Myxococcales bacterium]
MSALGGVLISFAASAAEPPAPQPSIQVESPAFAAQQEMPARFTCQGANLSPALKWSGVPETARSLVLIVDDPDAPDPAAPKMTWVHWVLYDLPPDAKGLPEGVAPAALPQGTRQGKNSWKKTGYGGPCPPIGRHRYFFKLFALDVVLGDLGALDAAALQKAMQGHVLARGELVGTYQKSK